jgi:hypothetical protein
VRQERSRPLVIELEAWLREQRTKLSRNNDTTKAINYCLNRWDAYEDGHVQLSRAYSLLLAISALVLLLGCGRTACSFVSAARSSPI